MTDIYGNPLPGETGYVSNLGQLYGANQTGVPLQQSLNFDATQPIVMNYGLDPNTVSSAVNPLSNTSVTPMTETGSGTGFLGNLQTNINADPLKAIGLGIQGFGSLAGTYLGFQQLGQAQDQLNFQRQAYQQQYSDARSDYEANLADRERRRRSASPTYTG